MYFYDTCALLELQEKVLEEEFLISDVTLRELESIKTSGLKDEETKYKARKAAHILAENQDKYRIITFKIFDNYNHLIPNDRQIIDCALEASALYENVIFYSKDICCILLAKASGLQVKFEVNKSEDYCGYKEVVLPDEALANIYSFG